MLGDETLKDGKNLANFYFIYLLGNTIKEYQNKWSLIPKYMLIFVWLLLNTCLVMIFLLFPESRWLGDENVLFVLQSWYNVK
jgi:hypothetical protein